MTKITKSYAFLFTDVLRRLYIFTKDNIYLCRLIAEYIVNLDNKIKILLANLLVFLFFIFFKSREGFFISDKKIEVLIVDDNIELCNTISKSLEKDGRFKVVGCSYDGENAIKDIFSKNPQIVILDILLPGKDGLAVLEEVRSNEIFKKMPIIALTAVGQENITRRILDLGANYIVLKPFNMEMLIQRLIEQFDIEEEFVIETPSFVKKKNISKEEYVTNAMQKIGIPINLKGYNYIRTAVLLCLDDASLLESITKLLYPAIADACETTSSRVERDIRHSIEIAWGRGSGPRYDKFLGYPSNSEKKPTNSAFISSVLEKTNIDLNFI